MTAAKRFNANSVLTTLFGGAISLMMAFVWNSVTETSRAVIRLETNQNAIQSEVQKTTGNVIPRAELELRFKNVESQLLEVRVHQQSIDLELLKLRESIRR